MNILKYLLDPQPRRGWRIVIVGMLIYLLFSYAQSHFVENGYITKSQGQVFFWLAILGWLVGVIGIVNHFRWFFASKAYANQPKQPWESKDDK